MAIYENTRIFPYEYEGQKRFADPMEVWQGIMESPMIQGDLAIHLERAYGNVDPKALPLPLPPGPNAPPPEPDKPPEGEGEPPNHDVPPPEPPGLTLIRVQARRVIADAMRWALQLPSVNVTTGKGATFEECENYYLEFAEFMDAKKKASAGSPTPSTASPATGSPAPWLTKMPSASGSTSPAPEVKTPS